MRALAYKRVRPLPRPMIVLPSSPGLHSLATAIPDQHIYLCRAAHVATPTPFESVRRLPDLRRALPHALPPAANSQVHAGLVAPVCSGARGVRAQSRSAREISPPTPSRLLHVIL